MQIIQLFLSLEGTTEIILLKLLILHKKILGLRKLNSPRLQRFLVTDLELKFMSIQEHKPPHPCVGGAVGRGRTIPV